MFRDTATAQVIPFETLIPSLTQYVLNPRDARFLERDEVSRTLHFRLYHIYSVHNYAMSEFNVPISISILTRVFGCVYDRVNQPIGHSREPPESRGRHSALPPDIEQQIIKWIEQNAAKSIAETG
jgi:hypothetical protein